MVHFSESADAFDSPGAVAAMEASISGAIGVATKLQAAQAFGNASSPPSPPALSFLARFCTDPTSRNLLGTLLQAMHAQLCTDSQYLSRVMRERVQASPPPPPPPPLPSLHRAPCLTRPPRAPQSRWEDDGMGMGK